MECSSENGFKSEICAGHCRMSVPACYKEIGRIFRQLTEKELIIKIFKENYKKDLTNRKIRAIMNLQQREENISSIKSNLTY